MPEGVALAADTATAVFRRFPDQAAAVKFIYFDRSEYGLKTGRYGGVAQISVPSIHLNIGYVNVEAFIELVRQSAKRQQRSRSAGPRAPYTLVDTTVAHELWHQIERTFEVRHYAKAMQLRRQLGLHLGVETLEHAMKGDSPKAPSNWQAAYSQLAQEVSPYATTSAREATAELFKLWWCRSGPVSPLVSRFGELVDQMLPPKLPA